MSEHLFLITASIIPLTVIIVFAMKYRTSAVQARLRGEHADDYRVLAEQSAAAQTRTAEALAAIAARLDAVEKVLSNID